MSVLSLSGIFVSLREAFCHIKDIVWAWTVANADDIHGQSVDGLMNLTVPHMSGWTQYIHERINFHHVDSIL